MYPVAFPSFAQFPVIGFDTETTGLSYPKDRVFGLCLALPNGFKGYWDIRRNPEVVRHFNREIKEFKGIIVMANAHFDAKMCHATGIQIPLDQVDCVITRAVLIDEQLLEYGLDALCKRYLKKTKFNEIYEDLARLFGGKPTRSAQIGNLHKAPPELVAPYGEDDAALTLELWQYQERIIEQEGLRNICDFERRAFPTLQRMTRRGIRVDLGVAEAAADKLDTIIEQDQKQLNDMVGFDVNVNSAPQVKKIFAPKQIERGSAKIWVADNGTQLEETGKGQPSIPSAILRTMNTDPRASLIVRIRSNIKTANTFLRGHVMAHSYEGRVYATINQTKSEDGGTGTGRLSYQDPALQQIPSRDKRVAEIVKEAFLPELGQEWVDSDLASNEVRVFAHLINVPEILEEYRRNPMSDFHQMVADMTNLPRSAAYSGQPNAKQLNLSMIFNSGNGAIAEKMGMAYEYDSFTQHGQDIVYKKAGPEAMAVIDAYHQRLPGIKDFASRAKKVAEQRGWVHTHYGRRYRFPRGYKSYKASGIIIQMTAADLNKVALIAAEEALGPDNSLLLNTHDSYSMSIGGDWEKQFGLVKEAIEDSFPFLRVPLVLELSGHGPSWWQAIKK